MRAGRRRDARRGGVEPTATAVHHLLDDGSFAITVPVDGVLAEMVVTSGTAGVQAVLEMTDYAPCRCASRCARWCGSVAAYRACPPPKSPSCSI